MEVKVRIRGTMHKWAFPHTMIQTVQAMIGEGAEECKTILKTIVVRLAGVLESEKLEGTVSDVEVVCLMHIRNQKGLPPDMEKVITAVLDGWKNAEESISDHGRKGLRVVERVLPVILTCQNREAFDKYFASTVYPCIESGEIKAIAKFLRVLAQWVTSEEFPVKPDSHYIEKYLERVFKNVLSPILAVKKPEVVAKRLLTTADLVEDYLDE